MSASHVGWHAEVMDGHPFPLQCAVGLGLVELDRHFNIVSVSTVVFWGFPREVEMREQGKAVSCLQSYV